MLGLAILVQLRSMIQIQQGKVEKCHLKKKLQYMLLSSELTIFFYLFIFANKEDKEKKSRQYTISVVKKKQKA